MTSLKIELKLCWDCGERNTHPSEEDTRSPRSEKKRKMSDDDDDDDDDRSMMVFPLSP
jgi:hypothetical protein